MTEYNIGIRKISEVSCCPTCGNSKVKETRKFSQHCSGEWRQSIEFECGAKYEYCTNFMQVGRVTECKDNPEFRARVQLVETVRKELIEHAAKRGLCDADMKQLRDKLQYFSVSTWH
jgi:hypothetical protein